MIFWFVSKPNSFLKLLVLIRNILVFNSDTNLIIYKIIINSDIQYM